MRLLARAPAPRLAARAAQLAVTACAAACAPAQDPPGRLADPAHAPGSPAALSLPPALPAPAEPGAAAPEAVAKEASLPGQGAKIASIAMRTWIYVAPDDGSTKLGYLRAGAVVDRAEQPAGTDGCAGGWYRILPRGYVCVGKGASLALDHQVVAAAVRGPERGAPAPYHYVISRSPPPHLYFRLPTRAEQEHVEGSTLGVHLAQGFEDAAVPLDPVPAFLAAGRELPKPYGAEEKLHYSVHTGRARESSAYGLVTTFEHTGRRFGLTTELDLIPLDRTRPARLSAHRGLVVTPEAWAVVQRPPPIEVDAELEPPLRGAPAFVRGHGAALMKPVGNGRSFAEVGQAAWRSGWVLTGRTRGGERGLLETTEGPWIAAGSLVIAALREDTQGFARSGQKWIDISIKRQLLVAYEGTRPAFATLVSTGRGGMGDPSKTHATIRGTFRIRAKHVSTTMDGDDEATEAFDLRDVPYTQFFHEGYALHGAYWHDDFGKTRSHGCVNLAPADAAWLFDWTEPSVPPEWHGAVHGDGGTLVYVHG
ncbi:MAG: L,D-transpeptidase [Polyangiaceae bacterium]|nr:L,D-transpeptidase [Polyangiaceae bacterium]